MREPKIKIILRLLLAAVMIAIGIDHFVDPSPFLRIVPAFLPVPLVLVYVSGFFEIAGGVGILVEKTRRFAGLGLCALYLAVFPANINMALNQIQLAPDGTLPVWMMWARLPFQLAFIGLAYWVSRSSARVAPGSS